MKKRNDIEMRMLREKEREVLKIDIHGGIKK